MKAMGLQEKMLNCIRKQGLPATFFLVNGFRMKGLIKAFDDYTVLIECDGMQDLLFKHAISTIMPSKPVDLHLLYGNVE